MPRAVDPPGRLPVDDYNPGSKNLLFDPATMPKFNLLQAFLKLIDKVLDWLIAQIRSLTGGRVDLGPLKEILIDTVNDFAAGIGTGQNLMAVWRAFAGIIQQATGINLTALLVELLPQLIELMSRLKEIADAGGQAVYELIMLPLNILRQIQNVISGQAPDWTGIPDAFRPLLDAMRRIFALISNMLGGIDLTRPDLILSNLQYQFNQAINRLANLSPLNWNLWGQIRGARVPATHVAEPSPELLDNPDFINPISIADREVWMHDGLAALPGMARVVCDGKRKTLVSNPMQVSPGMVLPIEVLVNLASVQAVANQNAVRMSINIYDWQANKTGTVFLAGIASPSGNATDRKLAATWTAGATAGVEDAWIALVLEVTAHATAGTVSFHHASVKAGGYTTPQIGFGVVQGIQGIFDIGGTMQSLWDSMQKATANIPGITSPGFITGASLADVAQGLHNLAQSIGLSVQSLRLTRAELGLPEITPTSADVVALGTTIITLPLEWDYIDLAALGGGGGGGSLFGIVSGQGGGAGAWNKITLIRDGRGLGPPPGAEGSYGFIHGDATSVTMFVGDGGAGGSGLVGEIGHSGQASYIQWTNPNGTVGTLWAAGGQWGGCSNQLVGGWNYSNPSSSGGGIGIGPGTMLYRERQYVGGTNVAPGSGQVPGSHPGGGAGPGVLRIIPDFGTWGGHGASGKCWSRTYTAAALEAEEGANR